MIFVAKGSAHRMAEVEVALEAAAKLQWVLRALEAAETQLNDAQIANRFVGEARRRLRRVREAGHRTFRIGILGEANSGKSSIANLIVEGAMLPATPMANTRLPTLLYYAPAPNVEVLTQTGQRFPAATHPDIALSEIVRLDVGLPSRILSRIEIVDCPGSANPLFHAEVPAATHQGIHGAMWATVATQAWRETERLAWSALPARIKKRGILIVTHSDLIRSEDDARKLRHRLEPIAMKEFAGLCFVAKEAAGGHSPQKNQLDEGRAGLVAQINQLASSFETERAHKVSRLVREIADCTLGKVDRGF
jgi:hypothetical protein